MRIGTLKAENAESLAIKENPYLTVI